MWLYESPIGTLRIARHNDGRYYFYFGDDGIEWTGSLMPKAVADEVFHHSTGCTEWDFSDVEGPQDLSEWILVSHE